MNGVRRLAWSCALALGLALAAMQQSRTRQAPEGANPLVVIASGASFGFLFTWVLAGSPVLVSKPKSPGLCANI